MDMVEAIRYVEPEAPAQVQDVLVTAPSTARYQMNITYNEFIEEYEGRDLNGACWWGQTYEECFQHISDANMAIISYRQHNPNDPTAWGESFNSVVELDRDSAGL